MRGLYFVQHGLYHTQAEGLCQALQESLAPIGLEQYETKSDAETSSLLMDACQKIYLSTIGVFDLSAPNPDAYLEIGISLGLNRMGLILVGQGIASAIPAALDQFTSWPYTPPLKPSQDLQRAVLRTIDRPRAEAHEPEDEEKVYCVFCDRMCVGWRKQTHGKGFFLLDARHPRWSKLGDAVRTGLSPTGLTPIYLSQLKGRVMPLLCEMRLAVLASEFVLADLSAQDDPQQYLALGMAISMGRPWLLTTSQPENLPRLLGQANRLEYTQGLELRTSLEPYVLQTLYPARFAAAQGATTQLELPFWLQLEDWIAHYAAHTPNGLEGALQLLLIEGGQLKQRCRVTPDMTIKAGRDPECDLVLETQGASRFHADFMSAGEQLLVVDLRSTNGTFVNGNRVQSEQSVRLEIGDRVRMGTAEIVVWNEAELPPQLKQYLPESGRIMPQTVFVDLAQGLVLADDRIPVARLSSSETSLLRHMCEKGVEPTTTSQVAEIVYGSGQVSRMIVASFIDGLRAKIEPSPAHPRFVVAVPGVGYRLRTRGGQLVLK